MPLITTTDEFKDYAGDIGRSTFTPGTWLPDMAIVEEEYILPVLGQAQYDALITAYNNGTPTYTAGDDTDKLVQKVRAATAQLCMYSIFPGLANMKSDAGMTQRANNERGEMPTTKWLFNADRISYLTKGLAAIDRLYNFLEANKADYALWTASDNYTQFKSLFLKTTKEFEQNGNVSINGSRRTFERLYPLMKDVEDSNINPLLGDDLFDDLKTKLAADTSLTTEEKKVMNFIYKIVANYTLAKGVKSLPFYFSNGAFTIAPNLPNDIVLEDTGFAKPSDTDMNTLSFDYENKANQLCYELKEYLNNTATNSVLAAYYNSAKYAEWAATSKPVNGPSNNVFTF